MKSVLPSVLLVATLAAVATGNAYAETVTEEFEIEGMVSPASPKALTAALEEKLDVKVAGYNFYNTDRGWPIIQVQFESGKTTRAKIEQVIAATSDPTGRKYKVHTGPPRIAADLLEEETKAAAALGPSAPQVATLKNPVAASPESTQRGEELYVKYCAKCHGRSGNGRHVDRDKYFSNAGSVAIFALQVLASRLWLARFRFGPAEWLCRTLAYGSSPPM